MWQRSEHGTVSAAPEICLMYIPEKWSQTEQAGRSYFPPQPAQQLILAWSRSHRATAQGWLTGLQRAVTVRQACLLVE